jgi:hypothetical protein
MQNLQGVTFVLMPVTVGSQLGEAAVCLLTVRINVGPAMTSNEQLHISNPEPDFHLKA